MNNKERIIVRSVLLIEQYKMAPKKRLTYFTKSMKVAVKQVYVTLHQNRGAFGMYSKIMYK